MGGGRKGLRTLGLNGGREELVAGGGEVGISIEVPSEGASREVSVVGASVEKEELVTEGSLVDKMGAGSVTAIGSGSTVGSDTGPRDLYRCSGRFG